VLSIPFLWDLVPRNRLYGFRIAATLRNERVWYAMNRRVAREMIPVGSTLSILALIFERAGLDTPVGRAVLGAVTLAAIAAIIVRGWIAANRMLSELQSSGQR
jgi:hypothetical protein